MNIYIFRAKRPKGEWFTVTDSKGDAVEVPATKVGNARAKFKQLYPEIYKDYTSYSEDDFIPWFDADRTAVFKKMERQRRIIAQRKAKAEEIRKAEEYRIRLQNMPWNDEPPLAPPGGVDNPSN